jgi:hypothetical protein
MNRPKRPVLMALLGRQLSSSGCSRHRSHGTGFVFFIGFMSGDAQLTLLWR